MIVGDDSEDTTRRPIPWSTNQIARLQGNIDFGNLISMKKKAIIVFIVSEDTSVQGEKSESNIKGGYSGQERIASKTTPATMARISSRHAARRPAFRWYSAAVVSCCEAS